MAHSILDESSLHPYFPPHILLPTHLSNTLDPKTLVASLSTGCTLILTLAYLLAVKTRPQISTREVLLVLWWTLCGSLHVFFEGYFIFHHADMPGRNDLLGQLWKEYALSDSRYMTRDPMIVCMEFVTVSIWGPLSFFIAYGVVTRNSFRHPIQLIVSTAHLYGDVLYYCVCWYEEFFNGVLYSRPERFYYWGYFIFCNAFWIFIPLILIVSSTRTIAAALQAKTDAECQTQKS